MSIFVNRVWTFSILKNTKKKGSENIELKSLDRLFYKSLGSEISKIRNRRGISLKELGEELSCSKQMVDNFELGRNRLKEDKFIKLCDYLDINPVIEVIVKFKERE